MIFWIFDFHNFIVLIFFFFKLEAKSCAESTLSYLQSTGGNELLFDNLFDNGLMRGLLGVANWMSTQLLIMKDLAYMYNTQSKVIIDCVRCHYL